jgi:hypothetical protein
MKSLMSLSAKFWLLKLKQNLLVDDGDGQKAKD